MQLAQLIEGIETESCRGDMTAAVCDVVFRADAVEPGGCFFALRGAHVDGHDFTAEAARRGAVVVVSERACDLPPECANVVVPDARRAMALMARRFFGDPTASMRTVGVTGTNGKTTITYLVEAILAEAGARPGVVGTIAYRFDGRTEPAPHTTPESVELMRLLARMHDGGADACAMEVSSHALVQRRVDGCRFDCAIFTNLTPEHLDYHGDMEAYFAAKAILFEELLAAGGKPKATAVINADDPYGAQLVARCPVRMLRFGFGFGAEVRGEELVADAAGLAMTIVLPGARIAVRSKLCGRFNAQNVLAAAAAAHALGIEPETIARAVGRVPTVPGRFEAVANERGVFALVDYAHTPDALENVLTHARELVEEGGELIVVFGCGGDRDRAKRPLMGAVVARLADRAIVTSDNPRTEEPSAIVEAILPGMTGGCPYEVELDRRRAIERAASAARLGDVVVVAGKGHEDYQIIGTTKRHFDDREVLAECLNG